MSVQNEQFLYIFLDEGGNFDFSPKGTPYFTLTAITKKRPFSAAKELGELKYDLVEQGLDIEYFHATEDRQRTRDSVFGIICKNLGESRCDSVIIEKRKTGPALQPVEKFYPKMLGYLLKYILEREELDVFREVIVFTDQIPIRKKRNAMTKAVKITLSEMLPKSVRYRIFHHDSKSNFDLQIADYVNWAIFRKWRDGDERSYNLIKKAIRSEFDIFRTGSRYYY